MKVFKFGGASIKDVESIKNVGEILLSYKKENLIVVFSAMGKITNMLEEVVDSYVNRKSDPFLKLEKIKDFHLNIAKTLFHADHFVHDVINNLFIEIEWVLDNDPNENYAYDYDQIVSVGEFLSTNILSAYLNQINFQNIHYDARDLIRTDSNFRNAKVDWQMTAKFINSKITFKHCVVQGFLGCNSENCTTTLGREGSDFSAAIFAYTLNAEELVIWKDVPGFMNADPKKFNEAKLMQSISYDEVIELAYYGAKVIHPKTVQPLKKKEIPLQIRSFINPKIEGSRITKNTHLSSNITSYILKENQILISISDPELEFIIETKISEIFRCLAEHQITVNIMQNSAVSFSICVDNDIYKIPSLLKDLRKRFVVFYNENLNLYTIKNYTSDIEYSFLLDKQVVLKQMSRNTIQVLVK